MIQLPALPFDNKALEPVISSNTLELHYGKHHQTYVNKLNELIAGTEFENKSLEEIIRSSTGPIFNNAAQIWNHTFYWNCLRTPQENNDSEASKHTIATKITTQRGSFETFKEQFSTSALTNFGSGRTRLVQKTDGSLAIANTSNAQTPLTTEDKPLLTIDIWEHAYYVDYQNRRAEYIAQWRTLVNRDFVDGQSLK